ARELVRDRAGRKLEGDRAIREALRLKGVAREEADRALADTGEEAARAAELAERQATRMAAVPMDAAYRRILGQLLRRGYSYATASDATRKALAARSEGIAVDAEP